MIQTLAALLVSTSVGQLPAIEPDLEVALGTVGLNARTARFDENLLRMFRQGHFTTPIYAATHENPWRLPLFAENLRRELGTVGGKPQETLTVLFRQLGIQVRRSLVGNPNQAAEEASKKEGALGAVLQDWKAKGHVATVPSLAGVPKEVQSAAALILATIPKSIEYRRLAVMDLGDGNAVFGRLAGATASEGDSTEFEARKRLGERIDLGYLAAGAFDLAAAVQEAQARIATVLDTESYHVKFATRWGVVVLSGGRADSHGAEPTLLAIDTGGNDTYANLPSNRSANHPVSIVIDGAGNDRYLSDEALAKVDLDKWPQRMNGGQAGGPCSAILGYAMLFDRVGDDVYRSHRPGIGSGRFGVAVCQDGAGNDVYDGYADSIGFGSFGVGIVEDLQGTDRYLGFNQVQGCGQTMGAGYLCDRAGDDQYSANDEVLDFPSAQTAQHNVSMAQGAANGRRGDYIDGHSMAGGFGLLLDEAGDDRYTCGVFGQGVGYWEGVGMLLDNAGKDSYSGQWYVQGASAHFAVGYLEDGSGDDTYRALMNMAQGAGHDFGTGALVDRLGNDTYTAPNLSLGAGNANGIGWFVDFAGVDQYVSSGLTLGSAAEATKTSLRARALCLGVFMDLGGDDAYPPGQPWAKNASRSAQVKDRGPTPAESQVGVFWDR